MPTGVVHIIHELVFGRNQIGVLRHDQVVVEAQVLIAFVDLRYAVFHQFDEFGQVLMFIQDDPEIIPVRHEGIVIIIIENNRSPPDDLVLEDGRIIRAPVVDIDADELEGLLLRVELIHVFAESVQRVDAVALVEVLFGVFKLRIENQDAEGRREADHQQFGEEELGAGRHNPQAHPGVEGAPPFAGHGPPRHPEDHVRKENIAHTQCVYQCAGGTVGIDNPAFSIEGNREKQNDNILDRQGVAAVVDELL